MEMSKISRESLMTLEAYHKARPEMRKQAIEERRKRSVRLGEHLNLLFESENFRRRRYSGRVGCLQPARTGWLQLQGYDDA